MYYKMTFSNGYCGCEEEVYEEFNTKEEAEEYAEEYLTGWYCFYEPDARFIGNVEDYESEEEYWEAYDEYQADCGYYIKEITKEEYEENEI